MTVTGTPYCHDCPHAPNGVTLIPPDGSGTSGILLVGDSGWTDEAVSGKPFWGAAGMTLNRQLNLVNIERRDVMVANALWCRALRLGWTDYPERYADANAALEHCRPNLDSLIERMSPRVMVPLGNVALRRVCGVSGIEAHAGYVVPTRWGVPAVPTYHPSFIMQGHQKLTAAVVFALNRARSIANGTYQPSHYDLLLDPPVDQLRHYVDSGGLHIPHLVVDIETPESTRLDEEEVEEKGASWTIVRAGFSLRQGTAVTFPFQSPYIEILQEVLDRADEFIEHADNHYDSRRLRHAGLRIPDRIISSMWAWHFLESDLRKGLGAVAPFFYSGPPWKDQSEARPEWYNCLHGDTMVPLWNGNWKYLSEIVRERSPELLIGCDEYGTLIPVGIASFHRCRVPGQRWLRVKTDNSRQDIRCTPDHRVWTSSGWKEAQELRTGDWVKSAYRGSNDLVWGTILGDSHVTERGYLSFTHCAAQKQWAARKAAHLGANLRPVPSKGHWTAEVSVGKRWRKAFYSVKGKVFPGVASLQSLAVWYCDDGCWAVNDETRHLGAPRFAAYGFVNFTDILEYFRNRYGMGCVSVYNPKGDGASVAVVGDARRKFFEDVAEFVPPEMQYKLPPEHRGLYNGWLEVPQSQWTTVVEVVEDVRPESGARYRWDHRYCVTVDHPTHRFYVMGGLVSNCMDNAVTMDVYLGTRRILEQQGRWAAFERHCIRMDTPLRVMGERGLYVDPIRQQSFMSRLEAEWDDTNARLQAAIPDSLKPHKFWKRCPKNVEGVVEILPNEENVQCQTSASPPK